jgi:PAS domain S-box-containing protein
MRAHRRAAIMSVMSPTSDHRDAPEPPPPSTLARRAFAGNPSHLLIWFGVLLISLSMVAAVLLIWQTRADNLEKAQTDLRRLALSQSEQTLAALKGADLALINVITQLKQDRGPRDEETEHRTLASIVAALPQLKNMFVIDADGNSLFSARSFPAPIFSVSASPFFQAHRDGDEGLRITPTFRARIDGRWSLLLTRRIDDAEGHFAGVVGADIDPVYLADLYAAIDLGPDAAIALLTKDQVLLARHPWIEQRIGERLNASVLRTALAQSRVGTARGAGSVDRVDRLYGYAALEDYPVVLVALMATSVVNRTWRTHATIAGAAVIAGDAIIALLIALLVAQMRRREDSEARFRDFADAASDWYWETGEEGLFTYVSRTGRGRAEFPIESVLGRGLDELVVAHPGDPTLAQLNEEMAARRLFRDFLCQMRTSSGRIWHLTLSGMPRFDVGGRFLGYRGAARDLTTVVEERSASARANMRFLYAMEHGTSGFSFWDAEDRFVVCNELYRQRAGRAARLLVPGVPFEKFYWESLRLGDVVAPPGRAADMLAERMARHRAGAGEAVVCEVGGKRLLSRDLRMPDGGILTVSTDISETAEGGRPLEVKPIEAKTFDVKKGA